QEIQEQDPRSSSSIKSKDFKQRQYRRRSPIASSKLGQIKVKNLAQVSTHLRSLKSACSRPFARPAKVTKQKRHQDQDDEGPQQA
ncbi:hypothetical protein PTTG_30626, partial [Puccinia triticina 1-1 BBBD Race 1]